MERKFQNTGFRGNHSDGNASPLPRIQSFQSQCFPDRFMIRPDGKIHVLQTPVRGIHKRNRNLNPVSRRRENRKFRFDVERLHGTNRGSLHPQCAVVSDCVRRHTERRDAVRQVKFDGYFPRARIRADTGVPINRFGKIPALVRYAVRRALCAYSRTLTGISAFCFAATS